MSLFQNVVENLILRELHQNHPGISPMKSLASSHFWLPRLDMDLEKLAKSCTACLSVKQAVLPYFFW